MINGILLKTGIFCAFLFFFASCGTDKAAYIAELKAEHDSYLQIFQKSFQDLKQQSEQVKATAATSDTILLQKLARIDTKISAYQELSAEKTRKYQVLIGKLEAGELTEAAMKSFQPQYPR